VESYALMPLIQHRAVYLPPALILLSQVVLGVTAGPLGIIVATPLAAAMLVAVNMLYVEDVLGDRSALPES
jgi:predicted PurR-regulated permease PerM